MTQSSGMHLLKALECKANVSLRSISLSEQGAIDPDEAEDVNGHIPLRKTGTRVTAP